MLSLSTSSCEGQPEPQPTRVLSLQAPSLPAASPTSCRRPHLCPSTSARTGSPGTAQLHHMESVGQNPFSSPCLPRAVNGTVSHPDLQKGISWTCPSQPPVAMSHGFFLPRHLAKPQLLLLLAPLSSLLVCSTVSYLAFTSVCPRSSLFVLVPADCTNRCKKLFGLLWKAWIPACPSWHLVDKPRLDMPSPCECLGLCS